MNNWKSIVPLFILAAAFAGCAARPAYFGSDARAVRENGASYWEASAGTAPYLQVRMRRPRGTAAPEAIRYAGTLSLDSIAPAVMRSTFTLAEGASASFHYDFNAPAVRNSAQSGPAVRFFPGALDVVVACARGKCRAESTPVEISPEGRVALTAKKIRIDAGAAKAAAEKSVKKDNECAILHDSLRSLRERDASIRSFTAKYGEAETQAMAKRVRSNYAAKDCAAWLDERGGVGAAWRRVRVAQWTSFRGR